MDQTAMKLFVGGPRALAQRLGRLAGLEIRRSGPSARDDLRLVHFLQMRGIELVLDVGANRGQFASQLFTAGYTGHIVSFEAIPQAHAALTSAATKWGDCWTVGPIGALSDCEGETIFHVNDAEATSSLLAASGSSLEHIPGTRPHSTLQVRTYRLDDLASTIGVGRMRSFLKIDVQGGEQLVLRGAPETLAKIDGLVVELSLAELYAEQPLAFEILPSLLELGFEVYDISTAYRDADSYRLFQIDVVLFRGVNGSVSQTQNARPQSNTP